MADIQQITGLYVQQNQSTMAVGNGEVIEPTVANLQNACNDIVILANKLNEIIVAINADQPKENK